MSRCHDFNECYRLNESIDKLIQKPQITMFVEFKKYGSLLFVPWGYKVISV